MIALAMGLTPTTIEVTKTEPHPIVVDKLVPDTPSHTPPVSEFGEFTPKEDNIYLSCVKTLRERIPDLPLLNAIDFPLNTITPKVGDIIKIKYPSNYHIALITKETDNSWITYNGNIPAGATSTIEYKKDDPKILGYFNMSRQRLIDNLTPIQKETLWNESGWSMYNPDGSVIRGKDGEWGVAQFMPSTWERLTELRRQEKVEHILLDKLNFEDQIIMFKYGWDKGVTWYGKPK